MTRANQTKKRLAMALAPMALALMSNSSLAQTVTWDASGANPATPTDGSGNWNTTTSANWSDGVTNSTWVNGNIAVIGSGGTAGMITINDGSGTVTANGINFNATGSGDYTIAAGGSNTLTLAGPALINVASGLSPTISAPIAGSAGMTVNGPGTLNLTGNNTLAGALAINSGGVVVATGGNLGASSNLVSVGTPNNGTNVGDPTGALTVSPGVNTTIGSFLSATNNAAANLLTIAAGGSLNVTSSSPLSGLNSSVNGAFVVGTPNALGAMTTSMTISGAGALNVNGGTNNSSFLAGIGNSNSSANTGTVTLDMSGLSSFGFTTGTGAIPAGGGNEFAVGHGQGAGATVSLAANSSITAGTISVGDGTLTPGLAGGGPNAPSNPSTLNLGSATNTLNANTILIGNHRTRGIVQWATGVNTGTLLIGGAAGGASTANITIGRCSSGTAANTASNLTLSGHDVTVQAGTVQVGVLDGGGGSGANKGGVISFDTGVFNVADLKLAVGISGAATGNINGTFNLGNNANSTGTLNVTNSFTIGNVTGGGAAARGSLIIKGGTANIGANIIDVSTAVTSNCTLSLTGGTLNMQGFAIGTTAGGTGGTRTIGSIVLPPLGSSAVLMNLGGNGINNAGLNMNATGNLILEGTNTYTGGTTISAGTLQVGQASDVIAPAGALQAAVTNNSILAFGSSQSMSVATLVSGTGGVNQVGSGTTTLTGSSSYTGPTSMVDGKLAVANLPNGGGNSPLGASSSGAANLVLSGGTLRYVGAGGSTDRLFTVAAPGGAIDASGSGAVNFNNGGSVVAADAPSRGTTTSAASNKVQFANVNDLVVGMTVTGTNIAPATTITAINRTTNTVTLSANPTLGGADTLSFSVVPRTLTLTGTNAGNNTLGNSLANSTGGGVLSVVKDGSGTWVLSAANTYTGATNVNAGTLKSAQSLRSTSGIAIADGARMEMTPRTAGVKTLQAGTLNLNTSGTLDLADNDLVVDAGSFTTIQAAMLAGFGTSGPGIISSTSDGSQILALFDNSLVGAPDWNGGTIGANAVVGKYTYFGDANIDGQVTGDDYTVIDANLNTTPAVGLGWLSGDMNLDGSVTGDDYTVIDANLGLGVGNPLSPSALSVVPEPGAVGVTLVSAVGILLRRRRSRV